MIVTPKQQAPGIDRFFLLPFLTAKKQTKIKERKKRKETKEKKKKNQTKNGNLKLENKI